MLKCSRERSVCAPQSLSAGTRTSPRESISIRYSVSAMKKPPDAPQQATPRRQFRDAARGVELIFLFRAGLKADFRTGFERNVDALPRSVINQPPLVAGPGGVHCDEALPGMPGELS